MILCLIYFVVGLARDALATLWYQAVSGKRAGHAGGLGGGLTAFDIIILGLLIQAWSPELIVSYSLGTGVGTYIIVKLRKEG
jgi:hypothetical protein